MLENERIIVDRGGIDPGIAALMQNANKGSVSPAANSKSVPVVKSDSTPLVGSEIQAGNRYWIYYNKCDNVMQVMNHYPAATA